MCMNKRLYHGSKEIIDKPIFGAGRPNNDYGLGDYLRNMRLVSGELLKDMAERLNLSPSMLSSIENGKRNPSPSFIEAIKRLYELSAPQCEELDIALAKTKEEIALNLSGLSKQDQDLAFSFARRLSELDDVSKQSIRSILSESEQK